MSSQVNLCLPLFLGGSQPCGPGDPSLELRHDCTSIISGIIMKQLSAHYLKKMDLVGLRNC